VSNYDVAIIGAGIQGAAAAMALADRGVSTVVIEKGMPASGPTGRSSAVVRGYYVNEFLARTTRESLDLFRSFEDWTHGGSASFVEVGALFVHAEEDGDKLHRVAKQLNSLDVATEVLDRDALAEQFPQFNLDGLAWGAWEPHAGHADPAGTTIGMLNRGMQLGAELKRNTTVVSIDRTAGGVTLRTDSGETITAGKLLVCAGPWTSKLLAKVDIEIPLWAERHIIATYGWGDAQEVPFVWASIPDGIYFKAELHAQYLVGTLWEEPHIDPDDFDHELAPDEQLRITEAVVHRIPDLENSEARSGYSAAYDVAPDWQPVIGDVDENIFVVAGTAGHGFKWAPGIGRHVADLVTGAALDPGLAQFHPNRFADGVELDAGYGAAKILG